MVVGAHVSAQQAAVINAKHGEAVRVPAPVVGDQQIKRVVMRVVIGALVLARWSQNVYFLHGGALPGVVEINRRTCRCRYRSATGTAVDQVPAVHVVVCDPGPAVVVPGPAREYARGRRVSGGQVCQSRSW